MANVGGGADLSQRFALDVQGFDALRAQAASAPQQSLKTAAKQFDAVFIQMMLKSMREATPQEGPLDSRDTAQFTSMLDSQLSQQMSSKGIGIANALITQLSRNAGFGGAGGASGAAGSLGSMGAMGALGGDAPTGNEGNTAMMSALARAYSNAAANGSLSKEPVGYSAASALTPPLRGNGSSSKVDAFVEKMAGPAQAASEATGIPARFIIGQAALESGWGKGEIKTANGAPSHNVFGIKATKDWTGKTVSTLTTEYVNGRPQKVVEKFRAYDSYEEAMTDYANLLRNNPRYASVVNSSRDAASFAHGMQRAGYATDPHYAKKLISIMQQMV
ncbi:flagellar assembly peptidoglycan hydrolase FlgJ [Trinickia caryophylli]|nr:flagellar assembly peptidoglycan hydrolase FlgJ [Trinickia caryophylli]TRX20333.1 flagellar assembly peptidoglycan hydrolase FlgJ [Trinickia caryophylli]